MGKTLKQINPVAKPESTAVAKPLAIRPATLVDTAVALQELSGLPAEFRDSETLSGFAPSPEWTQPGDAIFGIYIGMRTDVGPNHSRLYEVSAYSDDGKETLPVSIWGTAALDRLFDSAYPAVGVGDKIAIIYLGEKPTLRQLNPVKLFALKVMRAGGAKQALHAS